MYDVGSKKDGMCQPVLLSPEYKSAIWDIKPFSELPIYVSVDMQDDETKQISLLYVKNDTR